MIYYNRRIYAIGGLGERSKFLRSVESLDFDEMEWRIRAPMHKPRRYA